MKDINLPSTLVGLETLAYNLWWTWNSDCWHLFAQTNPQVWDKTHNPIMTLKSAGHEQLSALATNETYLKELNATVDRLQHYLTRSDRWFPLNCVAHQHRTIAYFSAEFGIHESIPIYSGGLGVLSGDHTKSASDLGVPMVFVGLFYHEGYFIQQINSEGQQVDVYQKIRAQDLPLLEAINTQGKATYVNVEFPERTVVAKVWYLQIGLNRLYLLDTEVEENSEEDRNITARLYGGDREMRISQELILGVGGVKALNELGIHPHAFHMNEGHSAFFQLERIANTIKQTGLNFDQAKTLCAANCVFTTHTPVPAGNESFALPLMQKYFKDYAENHLRISWGKFLSLGLVCESSDYKHYSLTVLAINLSRFYNGVSELHGKIAKKMWMDIWPNIAPFENPITHITNGVHVPTWTSNEMKNLFTSTLGPDWEKSHGDPQFWEKFQQIPNRQLKEVRHQLKLRMIHFVRQQLKNQIQRKKTDGMEIGQVDSYLNENVLTIGFARRFATYKRATLIFKDLSRLAKLVNDPQKPIQFIFAGKAHPADRPGQAFIKSIYEFSLRPEFKGKIIFLENYDMNISRHLVAGVDVWLNTPRRPMEASGTSGQKVPLNAGINFSVLDGWWREAHNGNNGWHIGMEKDYPSEEIQDHEDSEHFYRTLEESILPLYYRGEKLPTESNDWIEKSKHSLVSNLARFSTHRMVQDYVEQLYLPACSYAQSFSKNNYQHLNHYVQELAHLQENWNSVTFSYPNFDRPVTEKTSYYETFLNSPSHHVDIPVDHIFPGKVFELIEGRIDLSVYLGDISPDLIVCEGVITPPDGHTLEVVEFTRGSCEDEGLYRYQAQYRSSDGEVRHLRIRVYPKFNNLQSKFEFGLTSWL